MEATICGRGIDLLEWSHPSKPWTVWEVESTLYPLRWGPYVEPLQKFVADLVARLPSLDSSVSRQPPPPKKSSSNHMLPRAKQPVRTGTSAAA